MVGPARCVPGDPLKGLGAQGARRRALGALLAHLSPPSLWWSQVDVKHVLGGLRTSCGYPARMPTLGRWGLAPAHSRIAAPLSSAWLPRRAAVQTATETLLTAPLYGRRRKREATGGGLESKAAPAHRRLATLLSSA